MTREGKQMIGKDWIKAVREELTRGNERIKVGEHAADAIAEVIAKHSPSDRSTQVETRPSAPVSELPACHCEIPDPVMQADMRFYCHRCSFRVPAALCDHCRSSIAILAPSAAPVSEPPTHRNDDDIPIGPGSGYDDDEPTARPSAAPVSEPADGRSFHEQTHGKGWSLYGFKGAAINSGDAHLLVPAEHAKQLIEIHNKQVDELLALSESPQFTADELNLIATNARRHSKECEIHADGCRGPNGVHSLIAQWEHEAKMWEAIATKASALRPSAAPVREQKDV